MRYTLKRYNGIESQNSSRLIEHLETNESCYVQLSGKKGHCEPYIWHVVYNF